MQRFDGVTKRPHSGQQSVGLKSGHLVGLIKIAESDPLCGQPSLIRTLCGELCLQLLIWDEPTLFKINQKHATGLETPFLFDIVRIQWQHTDFTCHDDTVIMCHVITTRSQAIAVEQRTNVAPIGERDGCRSVPGLHQRRMELVERLLVNRHCGMLLPRLRHHHHDCFLQRTAGHQQKFKDVVEIS